MTTEIQTVWPAELSLGEGPVWHAASGRFLFVDLHGCAIHAWNPSTGLRESWKAPERIGWLIPRADGDGFMAGLQSGFFRLWLEPDLRFEFLASPHPHSPDTRMNDAKADRWGRIWAGSMNNRDPSQPDGQLARLDPDGSFSVVETNIHIANGPAIASDGSWLLHTDSYLNTVYRYGVLPDGSLTDKQVWRIFTQDEGTPDGMTIDADGHVWIAFWGGACVRQFTPAAVTLRTVMLPALQVTSVALGGEKLDMLLLTSARVGMSPEQLQQYPQSGAVFAIHTGVVGLEPSTFGQVAV